ncbi:MAG: T9SS type A sorting domain-containing protein [Saprospiraceae bacterium]|nr:T9SS type A sorting domain-containing protein [Saprospiraceae bacterium]
MKLRSVFHILCGCVITVLSSNIKAQNHQIGSGTATTSSNEASPVNIWYRRTTCQIVYTASELNSAGIQGASVINASGWYMSNIPIYALPYYTIKIKHTTAIDVSSPLSSNNWTTVVNPFAYTPSTLGYDMINYDTPFQWNGVDNIAMEICWSQVSPTYHASGQCRYYPQLNGFRYSRTDAPGTSCGSVPSIVSGFKPQIQFQSNSLNNPCLLFSQSSPVTTNTQVCAGDIATLSATTNHNGVLKWYDAPVGGNLIFTGSTFIHSPNQPTSYWVEETLGTCISNRSKVDVAIKTILPPPITIDDATCTNSIMTLSASSSSGASSSVFNWYDAAINGNLIHTGSSYSVLPFSDSTFWVEEIESISTANMLDHGNDVSFYSGRSRGYFFIAPTSFTITGLRVPTDQSIGNQSVEVVRFSSTPPNYPVNTNNFVSLFRATDIVGASVIPCNITVNNGDKIAIIGSRGNSCINSYGLANYSTTIAGSPVVLKRCGMQGNIATTSASNIWKEDNNPIGRIEMYYDASFGCTSSRVPVNAFVSQPDYAPAGSTISANLSCVVNENGVDWEYYYNNANPDNLLFAIAHDPYNLGNNNFVASVDISTTANPNNPADFNNGIYKSEDYINQNAYFALGRYWNISYTGTLVDPVNIRFYYNPDEQLAIETAASSWAAASYNGANNLIVSNLKWIKTTNAPYVPANTFNQGNLIGGSVLNPYTIHNNMTTNLGVNYVEINNLNDLSGGTAAIQVYSGQLMSAELYSFDVQKLDDQKVQLNWITESENQLSHFEIQRSHDGISFHSIGNRIAEGSTSFKRSYSMLDKMPLNGPNYYRLKMIKEDGELEFSIIRVVVFRKENVDLMVFPNPFDKEITIRFESTKNDNLHLNMFNSIGQQVYESVYRINKGNNNLDLNIQGDLSKGAYIMRIQADNYTTFKKIIKR